MLCGPPGSGKTMTLFSALRALPDLEVVGLNFSSATTPELLLKTFDHYCEYRKTPNGVVLSPILVGCCCFCCCYCCASPDHQRPVGRSLAALEGAGGEGGGGRLRVGWEG